MPEPSRAHLNVVKDLNGIISVETAQFYKALHERVGPMLAMQLEEALAAQTILLADENRVLKKKLINAGEVISNYERRVTALQTKAADDNQLILRLKLTLKGLLPRYRKRAKKNKGAVKKRGRTRAKIRARGRN